MYEAASPTAQSTRRMTIKVHNMIGSSAQHVPPWPKIRVRAVRREISLSPDCCGSANAHTRLARRETTRELDASRDCRRHSFKWFFGGG